MSLEDRIEKLTAALERNSDILERGIKKSGAAPAPTADTAPAAAPKAAAAGRKPAAVKAPKGPTEEDIRANFGTYLAVKDKAEKDARKDNVRAILNHFGVGTASEIPEDNRADAIAYLKQFVAGETPDFMNEGGEGDEGGEEEESLL